MPLSPVYGQRHSSSNTKREYIYYYNLLYLFIEWVLYLELRFKVKIRVKCIIPGQIKDLTLHGVREGFITKRRNCVIWQTF
jgi:hypothetical protein